MIIRYADGHKAHGNGLIDWKNIDRTLTEDGKF